MHLLPPPSSGQGVLPAPVLGNANPRMTQTKDIGPSIGFKVTQGPQVRVRFLGHLESLRDTLCGGPQESLWSHVCIT